MRNLWLLSGLSAGLAVIALIIAVIALSGSAAPAQTSALPDKSNPTDYTVAFVREAVRYYQENGREATLNYYNSRASVDGPWYVFIYDDENIRIAHPIRPDLLGLPVTGPTGVDITGYAYGEVMAETTSEGQWVDYVFLNPDTGFQQRKHSWLVKHDGITFGSGWYQGSPVQAADKSNPTEYAVSLVNAALRRYAREGPAATIEYYNSPESVDGEWYVFIIDGQGNIAATVDQGLVGQNLTGSLGVDLTGYPFGEVITAADENGQWVDYVFSNPDTGFQQRKHSWVIRHDGMVFGAGWYQGSPIQTADKSNPVDYTVALVNQALRRYDRDGRAATISYYNTPESVDAEWYVFIIDEQGKVAANADQSLVGQDLTGPLGVDITGYRFGEVMAAADENGQWVDYVFNNPDTGFQQRKHSWVIQRDGLIFGSGWYQGAAVRAADKTNPIEYTVSLVDAALRRYARDGRDATIEYYNSPESVDGDWYVFIIEENGRLVAHPNQDFRGENLKGDLGIDIAQYRFGDVILAVTEEGDWVDYMNLNPVTGNQEFKQSWVVRRDGLLFGAGWYQAVPPLGITKADPRAYAVSQVEQATELYQSRGRDAALQYYNSPENVDGSWYVFIIDENDRLIAHPNQALLGVDMKGDLGVDSAGYRFGTAMLAAPAEGHWVDYVYLNPASGNQEFKHTWAVRHDGLIFGSGWYQVLPNLATN